MVNVDQSGRVESRGQASDRHLGLALPLDLIRTTSFAILRSWLRGSLYSFIEEYVLQLLTTSRYRTSFSLLNWEKRLLL
jgi:hypothetical protein